MWSFFQYNYVLMCLLFFFYVVSIWLVGIRVQGFLMVSYWIIMTERGREIWPAFVGGDEEVFFSQYRDDQELVIENM
jgi:hypothetical protein